MSNLIDKSALVAEINKRIIDAPVNNIGHQRVWAYNDVKDILDTLDVKEVDIEEELESFAYTLPHSAIGDGEHLGKFDDPKVKEARKHGWSHLWRYNYVKEIAKHFFELGLKTSNPLTWKDMAETVKIANLLEIEWLNSTPWDGIRDCGFYTEVLKRFKAKKGE